MSIYLGTNLISGTQDISGKANTDFDNITSTAKNIGNWSSNVTNCITYIPQDIKLELDNGTLTLKAGSKVYVPNGFESDGTTPKFDVVTIESDILQTSAQANGICTLYYNTTNSTLNLYYTYSESSGTSAPSGDGTFYNTSTNNIYRYTGGAMRYKCSLPLAHIKDGTSTITSIDQVFNGFGYIGSTVFALPGVKGLIPNGRNADGSLKNIETSVSSVSLLTLSSSVTVNGNGRFLLNASGGIFARVGSYDEKNNYVLGGNGVEKLYGCVFADNCIVTSGVIKTLNTRTSFHALDYNDSSTISGWGMPSNKYIDLTLGASGTRYTAPANGYFTIKSSATSNGGYVIFTNESNGMTQIVQTPYNGNAVRISFPILRGQKVIINYTSISVDYFRFIYAEGE